MCLSLGVSPLATHSLHRGGAQTLARVGVPLAELKESSWGLALLVSFAITFKTI